MTRAKDISKIVTDADLSGTLDVTGAVTAGGLSVENTASNTVERTTAATNFAVNNTNFKATTSGDMVDGFGGALVFGLEDNASVDNSVAYLNWARDGADNSGELTFRTVSSGTSRDRLNLASNGDISFYEDTGTTAKLFWDASAESLEVGGIETTQQSTLMVKTDTNNFAIYLEENSGQESWQVGVNVSGDLGFYNSGSATASVTIDDSDNLLVGTTNSIPGAGNTAEGASIYNDGRIFLSKSANTVASFNRNTSDGAIAEFRKDGSTVGSIGSNTSGTRLHIGNSNVGLCFAASGSNAIIPWDTTANAVEDANLNLGGATARFNDIFLSNSVRLDGVTRDFSIQQDNYGLRVYDNSASQERFRIDASGAVTMPYQPAFQAYGNTDASISSIATMQTIIFNTEIFDQNSDFNTSNYRFTAPVTGKYQLNAMVRIADLQNDSTFYLIQIQTSNKDYKMLFDTNVFSADLDYHSFTISVLADMDANDIAVVQAYQNSGTVGSTIVGSFNYTVFSGYLVA